MSVVFDNWGLSLLVKDSLIGTTMPSPGLVGMSLIAEGSPRHLSATILKDCPECSSKTCSEILACCPGTSWAKATKDVCLSRSGLSRVKLKITELLHSKFKFIDPSSPISSSALPPIVTPAVPSWPKAHGCCRKSLKFQVRFLLTRSKLT